MFGVPLRVAVRRIPASPRMRSTEGEPKLTPGLTSSIQIASTTFTALYNFFGIVGTPTVHLEPIKSPHMDGVKN